MKLSIIMPVYNEDRTLDPIIKKVLAVKLPQDIQKEIIIVDDGSTDNTNGVLEDFKDIPGLKIIHQENQGKTSAVLTGMRASSGDILVIQDADLEYDPEQYPDLLTPILNGKSQVVYGSRFLGTIEQMQCINRWANNVSNWTINILYRTQITDLNTCYKMFTRQALKDIYIKGKNFDFDSEVTVKLLRKGLSIKEVPIQYIARSRESGKKIKWSSALALFGKIIKYRFCPPEKGSNICGS